MKKTAKILIFFIGWLLSPFTWWNDTFVNIPLSYIIANFLFYIAPLPFGWLLLGSYWFTNAAGLFFIYFSGKNLIMSAESRNRAAAFLMVFVVLYSSVMIYLDRHGKFVPLCKFFQKYHVPR